jgi:primase-polymerase (primpol)-like protein
MQDILGSQNVVNEIVTSTPVPPSVTAHPLAHLNQFIIHKNKIPSDYRTGQPANAHGPAVWAPYDTATKAAAHFGEGYGVGFVFTDADPHWFVDIDKCAVNGQWSQTALDLCALFQGSYIEVSQSGAGLHIVGTGIVPPHGCRNKEHGLEFYTSERYMALGHSGQGDPRRDTSALMGEFVAKYFPPEAEHTGVWSKGHELGWELPDDDELIRRALRMTGGPNAVFGDGVTFKDLWEANESVLGKAYPSEDRAYDASSADMALASKLAWLTGNDCPKIETLMWKSKLARDKWETHRTYLSGFTIPRALVKDGDFYNPNHYIDEAKRRREQIEEATRIGEGSEEHTTAEVLTLDQMIERFIYIGDGDRVQDLKHPREVVPFDQFVKFHRSSKTEVVVEGKTNKDLTPKTKMVETTRLWEHGDRKQVKTVTFRPGAKTRTEDPNGNPASNTWTPFDRSKQAGDPSMFLNHVEYLFGADTPRFLDWLAHIEQHPGDLPHTSWVHISLAQGKGRNWLANVLCRVWKGHVANSFNLTRMLRTGFDGRLSQKLLVIVDEINEGGNNARWENSETLKSMVTLEQREINPKYGYPIVEWNAARWLMFSNHLSALPLDDTDRRYEVVRHDSPPKPPGYYKQIWAAVSDPGFIAGVAQFLAQRDIRHFNPGAHAHMSEAKRDLVQASRTETDDMVAEIIDSHPADVIASSTLGAKLNNQAFVGSLTGHQRHALDRAGAVTYGKKVWLTGKTVNVRILRNHELWKAATPQQILAEMAKGSAPGLVAGSESRLQ